MKKLEDRCRQLSRDKEELCQALTALKKGQSIAAGPGQTRTVNLMRRVHTLVPSSGPAIRNSCMIPQAAMAPAELNGCMYGSLCIMLAAAHVGVMHGFFSRTVHSRSGQHRPPSRCARLK